MSGLRLAVFDVDGTLIDSLHAIVHAMQAGFTTCGLAPPSFEAVRGIVGLSVPEAVAALAPASTDAPTLQHLDREFRRESIAYRETTGGASRLFPGAREALVRLNATDALLAVATGKARRGLDHDFAHHEIGGFFVASQTADDAPSKPHPGMLENCARLTGAEAQRTIMIGDTTFDIEMARHFGCASIGVSWGYHPPEALRRAGAEEIIDGFDDLDIVLDRLWSRT